MNIANKFWLAGILEGEGCFLKQTKNTRICISVQMTDEDVVARVANILNSSLMKVKSKNPKHKDSYVTRVYAKNAESVMREIFPLMGIRRKDQIQKALDSIEYVEVGLTKEQLYDILSRRGESAKALAKEYGVTNWRIYQIWRGEFSEKLKF